MKVSVGSFYQVRFFDSSVIGLSTAMWDPAWFHGFADKKTVFVNEKGFVCGLKAPDFILPLSDYEELERRHVDCGNHCTHDSPNCEFMKAYRKHLESIGYEDIMRHLRIIADKYDEQGFNKTDKPTEIVLLVHESVKKNCAERVVIKQFFDDYWDPIKDYESRKGEIE